MDKNIHGLLVCSIENSTAEKKSELHEAFRNLKDMQIGSEVDELPNTYKFSIENNGNAANVGFIIEATFQDIATDLDIYISLIYMSNQDYLPRNKMKIGPNGKMVF